MIKYSNHERSSVWFWMNNGQALSVKMSFDLLTRNRTKPNLKGKHLVKFRVLWDKTTLIFLNLFSSRALKISISAAIFSY